ncbi:hypothetical protein DM794_04290 [Paenarthrobacter ureafaciens]|nr:hypothetical protein [Paenarthrobacter ureafaciens]
MERVDSMKNATRSGGIFSISFISERRLSPSKPEACTQDTTEIGGSGQLQYAEIRRAITPARLTAFDRAAQSRGASHDDAINLYEWNAELASALLLPLHLFEVVLRNAIHEALTRTYMERWPWDNRSLYSVPQKHGATSLAGMFSRQLPGTPQQAKLSQSSSSYSGNKCFPAGTTQRSGILC